jgi:hypothetical protein
MRRIACLLMVLLTAAVSAQTPAPNANPASAQASNQTPTQDGVKDVVYICPHHREVRSNTPGVCPICGLTLVENTREPVEYHMDLTVTPRPLKVGQQSQLKFVVRNPFTDEPVTKFLEVHERLFHLFIVSQDLQFFKHDHPTFKKEDAAFYYDLAFPVGGMYRVLGDIYPDGATPQLILKTLIVPGTPPSPVKLERDYSSKAAENMRVELETVPPQAISAQETQLHFKITPSEGLQKYLGAWGHMLAASDDLIDMIHLHPFIADGGPQIEFKVVFPRARTYRVWVQFQRNGVVNTAHFDIPVKELGL